MIQSNFLFLSLSEDRQEQLDRLMEKLNEHDKKIEAIKSQTKTE